MPSARMVIKAPSPADRDSAGLYRWGAAIAGVLAAGVGLGAAGDRAMQRSRRALVVASALSVSAWSARAFRDPAHMGRLVVDRPGRMLVAGMLPVALAPAMSPHFGFLQMSAVGGMGYAAAAVDPRRRYALGAASALWWLAGRAARTQDWRAELAHRKLVVDWLIFPLALVASARITPDARIAARELDLLRQKLDVAGRDADALGRYRVLVGEALDRFEVGLLAARRSATDLGDDELGARARDLVTRGIGRLQERRGVLDVAGSRPPGVQTLLERRVLTLQRTLPRPVDVRVDLAPGTEVTDPRVLAVLAATTVGAVTNAVRHADARVVRVTLRPARDPGMVELVVQSDGVKASDTPVAVPGAGLQTLYALARDLGGQLSSDPGPDGTWELRLVAPRRQVVRVEEALTSARMVRLIDHGLRAGLWMDAAMAAAIAIDGKQLTPEARGRARIGTAGVLAAFAALELGGMLTPAPGRPVSGERAAPFQLALWAAAAVSARSDYYDNSLWSGWATLALARLSLRVRNAPLVALTAAHTLAVLTSYRGRPEDRLRVQAEQLITTLIGPLTVQAVRQRLGALDRDERTLQARLVTVEQLHDVAEALHSSHPVTGAVAELEQLLSGDDEAVRRFREARRALVSAARALPTGHNAFEFADQFAEVLAARIYPTSVEFERDDDELAQLSNEAIVDAGFRRTALGVADRLGDVLSHAYPTDWLTRPTLESIELIVGADPATDTILLYVTPRLRSSPDPRRLHALARSLADAGGTVEEGFGDGRIKLAMSTERRRTAHGR